MWKEDGTTETNDQRFGEMRSKLLLQDRRQGGNNKDSPESGQDQPVDMQLRAYPNAILTNTSGTSHMMRYGLLDQLERKMEEDD